MAKIIKTQRNNSGVALRIQQRGNLFDVLRVSSNGYNWSYVEKGVSEQRAENTFSLLLTY